MTISFFIPGTPKSTQTGSVIKVRGRTFPVYRNTPWSATCGLVAMQHQPASPIAGAVRVALTFHLKRPKKPRGEFPTGRPDCENLSKKLLDAWNGVLWNDDAQVVDLRLMKLYAVNDMVGVAVQVEEL